MKKKDNESQAPPSSFKPKGLKKRNKINFAIKFNIKGDKKLKTSIRVNAKKSYHESKTLRIPPMFEQSDILFLSKPMATGEKENERKIISVDISKKRQDRLNNSKTTDIKKKMFKKKKKKTLKLRLRKSIKTIYEVPTFDRELNFIYSKGKE
jgi:NMD protein affecting ribosome stability and mRNA decay